MSRGQPHRRYGLCCIINRWAGALAPVQTHEWRQAALNFAEPVLNYLSACGCEGLGLGLFQAAMAPWTTRRSNSRELS